MYLFAPHNYLWKPSCAMKTYIHIKTYCFRLFCEHIQDTDSMIYQCVLQLSSCVLHTTIYENRLVPWKPASIQGVHDTTREVREHSWVHDAGALQWGCLMKSCFWGYDVVFCRMCLYKGGFFDVSLEHAQNTDSKYTRVSCSYVFVCSTQLCMKTVLCHENIYPYKEYSARSSLQLGRCRSQTGTMAEVG